MADGPPDLQPASPDLQPASLKDLHAGEGSASMWNRGFSSLESGVGNASRVEQTEIARVCTIGRHPEGQKDWEPAGKLIGDIRLQRDMAAIPEGVTSCLSCPGRTLNLCPVRLAQRLAVQGHWHTDGREWWQRGVVHSQNMQIRSEVISVPGLPSSKVRSLLKDKSEVSKSHNGVQTNKMKGKHRLKFRLESCTPAEGGITGCSWEDCRTYGGNVWNVTL